MNVGELIDRIINAKIRYKGNTYDSDILYDEAKPYVAWIIRDWAQKQDNVLTARIAELEAKVYAYEQIIANSNFKAVLTRKPKKENNNG